MITWAAMNTQILASTRLQKGVK